MNSWDDYGYTPTRTRRLAWLGVAAWLLMFGSVVAGLVAASQR